jgi:hypothetical protein
MVKTGLLGLPLPAPPAETRALKQALLNQYGHFADKRIKNIDKSNLFIVDDRGRETMGRISSCFLVLYSTCGGG